MYDDGYEAGIPYRIYDIIVDADSTYTCTDTLACRLVDDNYYKDSGVFESA